MSRVSGARRCSDQASGLIKRAPRAIVKRCDSCERQPEHTSRSDCERGDSPQSEGGIKNAEGGKNKQDRDTERFEKASCAECRIEPSAGNTGNLHFNMCQLENGSL
ncbi:unnamed protein product [Pleuronectes platessa]|uniref:Uncharacterized protein n=1 Tax=Pleuronectes platessa TaxID=8262 RepID=A0A9N7TUV2_PLEPL|nr:unnamed protein product [Pleuronectes platessa]